MLKKLLLISVVCISLMALAGTNANAYPQKLGGWPTWPGSVYMLTTWVGISDTLQRPADAWATLRIKSFLIDEVSNGGDQHGGIGQPWIEVPINPVTIGAGGTIFDIPLKGKGKYDLPIEFTDHFLSQQIKAYCASDDADEDLCNQLPKLPNDNWYWHVVVLEMDVLIQGFTDVDSGPSGRCESDFDTENCMDRDIYDEDGNFVETLYEEEVVFAVGECRFPGLGAYDTGDEDDWPHIIDVVEDYFATDSSDPYDCTENFNWQYKNRDRTCDDELGLNYPVDGETYQCNYAEWWDYNPVP